MLPVITSESEPELFAKLVAGAHEFDTGRYWHAHEEWEEGWRAYTAPDRDFCKGLIQFTVIQHHLNRGAPSAARALLVRGRVPVLLDIPSAGRWPVLVPEILAVHAAQLAVFEQGGEPAVTSLKIGPMLAV